MLCLLSLIVLLALLWLVFDCVCILDCGNSVGVIVCSCGFSLVLLLVELLILMLVDIACVWFLSCFGIVCFDV